MPASPGPGALHGVRALAFPVIVNPFNFSVSPGAPKLMQGPPVTAQFTSPTSSLLSVMTTVLEMVPLISVARADPVLRKSATSNDVTPAVVCASLISASCLKRCPDEYGGSWRQESAKASGFRDG